MPALVNSNVGSFCGTSDEECTSRCPFSMKKSRNLRRISEPVSMSVWRASTGGTGFIAETLILNHRGHRGSLRDAIHQEREAVCIEWAKNLKTRRVRRRAAEGAEKNP